MIVGAPVLSPCEYKVNSRFAALIAFGPPLHGIVTECIKMHWGKNEAEAAAVSANAVVLPNQIAVLHLNAPRSRADVWR